MAAIDFQDLVDAHNRYRANHNAPPLSWDDGLAANAQLQANECEARSMLFHGLCYHS